MSASWVDFTADCVVYAGTTAIGATLRTLPHAFSLSTTPNEFYFVLFRIGSSIDAYDGKVIRGFELQGQVDETGTLHGFFVWCRGDQVAVSDPSLLLPAPGASPATFDHAELSFDLPLGLCPGSLGTTALLGQLGFSSNNAPTGSTNYEIPVGQPALLRLYLDDDKCETSVESGGSQSCDVGGDAPDPFVVALTFGNGDPIIGADVIFTVPDGGVLIDGSSGPVTKVTDSSGFASVIVTGEAPGDWTVRGRPDPSVHPECYDVTFVDGAFTVSDSVLWTRRIGCSELPDA